MMQNRKFSNRLNSNRRRFFKTFRIFILCNFEFFFIFFEEWTLKKLILEFSLFSSFKWI